MRFLSVVLALALQGLVIGALGRLAIPGPNPMSIGRTIIVGIGGSVLAGLVGYFLGGRPPGLLLGVLGATGIVFLLQGRQDPNQPTNDEDR